MMSQLFDLVTQNEAALREIVANQPDDHLDLAVQELDRLDHLAKRDPQAAEEQLGAFLLELPQGASMFADLVVAGVKLNPKDVAKLHQLGTAIGFVRNTYIQAKSASQERKADSAPKKGNRS